MKNTLAVLCCILLIGLVACTPKSRPSFSQPQAILDLTNGETDVPLTKSFTADFYQPIDVSTLNRETFFIVPASLQQAENSSAVSSLKNCHSQLALPASISCEDNLLSCKINLEQELDPNTIYYVCLLPGVKFSGEPKQTDFSGLVSQFKTEGLDGEDISSFEDEDESLLKSHLHID